jgi:hypothetical protein
MKENEKDSGQGQKVQEATKIVDQLRSDYRINQNNLVLTVQMEKRRDKERTLIVM